MLWYVLFIKTWRPHRELKLGITNMLMCIWKIIPYKLDCCIHILIFLLFLLFIPCTLSFYFPTPVPEMKRHRSPAIEDGSSSPVPPMKWTKLEPGWIRHGEVWPWERRPPPPPETIQCPPSSSSSEPETKMIWRC